LLTATQLLGAEGMIVGINPSVAQAFIAAGAEFPRVRTLATLREALQRCLQTS
jgi:anti-anti-sigma regulatory factor